MEFHALLGYDWSDAVDLKDSVVHEQERKIMKTLREIQRRNLKALHYLLLTNEVVNELDCDITLNENDHYPHLTLKFEGKECILPKINNSKMVNVVISISGDKISVNDEYIIYVQIIYGGYRVVSMDIPFSPEKEVFVDIYGIPFEHKKKATEVDYYRSRRHDFDYFIETLMTNLEKYRVPPEMVFKNAAAADL